ncbi:hypothetical protein HDU76_009146 [Blyttiomyces sp. JEL0837]|nr:hypothetical protein HDU76_009146 [Blyttiomyces sp. JEL0837]
MTDMIFSGTPNSSYNGISSTNTTTTFTTTNDPNQIQDQEDSGWEEEFDPKTLIGHIIHDSSTSPTLKLRLTHLLGSGSYALVYSAESLDEVDSNDSIAVKCLFKSGLSKEQLALQRFEAEILEGLKGHDGVVSLRRVVETKEFLFIVLDRCDEDLYEAVMSGKVCAKGPFYDVADEMDMVDNVKDVFSQLVDAVAFCHSNGVYHRDLKPENILTLIHPVTGELTIKITDFGLSTVHRYPLDYGAGSISYTSPESLAGPTQQQQLEQNEGYDAVANDVWSLGVILFNMLTSKNPWYSATMDDSSFVEFVQWCREGTSRRPSPLRQKFNLSEHCDRIFTSVFELDPTQRCSLDELRDLVLSANRFIEPARKVLEIPFAAVSTSTSEANVMQKSVVSSSIDARRKSWSSDFSDMDFSAVPVFEDISIDANVSSARAAEGHNESRLSAPDITSQPQPQCPLPVTDSPSCLSSSSATKLSGPHSVSEIHNKTIQGFGSHSLNGFEVDKIKSKEAAVGGRIKSGLPVAVRTKNVVSGSRDGQQSPKIGGTRRVGGGTLPTVTSPLSNNNINSNNNNNSKKTTSKPVAKSVRTPRDSPGTSKNGIGAIPMPTRVTDNGTRTPNPRGDLSKAVDPKVLATALSNVDNGRVGGNGNKRGVDEKTGVAKNAVARRALLAANAGTGNGTGRQQQQQQPHRRHQRECTPPSTPIVNGGTGPIHRALSSLMGSMHSIASSSSSSPSSTADSARMMMCCVVNY